MCNDLSLDRILSLPKQASDVHSYYRALQKHVFLLILQAWEPSGKVWA